jgi:hypothetical protein
MQCTCNIIPDLHIYAPPLRFQNVAVGASDATNYALAQDIFGISGPNIPSYCTYKVSVVALMTDIDAFAAQGGTSVITQFYSATVRARVREGARRRAARGASERGTYTCTHARRQATAELGERPNYCSIRLYK